MVIYHLQFEKIGTKIQKNLHMSKKMCTFARFFGFSDPQDWKKYNKHNMTKAELINEIAIKTGYDKRTIGLIVESAIDNVKGSLVKGEPIYLRGFGSFILKTRKAKVARNIRAKSTVDVPEHSIPYFKASNEFKDMVRTVKGK